MKLIIGSYRGPELVMRALESLWEHAIGIDAITIVDDSGNLDWARQYQIPISVYPDASREIKVVPKVVSLNRRGYAEAMQAVCTEAGNERFIFWEEDFVLLEQHDFNEISKLLDANPDLAQIVLLRQPWFPNEIAAGSVIAAMETRLGVKTEDRGHLIVHDATFSCNPAVWRENVAPLGWPQTQHSEDIMTTTLVTRGDKFAWLEGQSVLHAGKRSGSGY